MPYSSGTFSRIYDWTNEQASSPIEIAKLDEQEADFATGLSNCILRDGTGLPTAAQDWNGQNLTNVAAFTATGIVTGGRFVPTSSSAPTNGMYLSAANTLAFSTNSTLAMSISSAGAATVVGSVSATALIPTGSTVPANGLYLSAANTPALASNSTLRWSVNSTGNHTIAAPSSSTTLLLNSLNGAVAYAAQCASAVNTLNTGYGVGLIAGLWNFYTAGADGLAIGTGGNAGTFIYTNSTQRVQVGGSGNVTINAPSSGVSLSVAQVSGGRGIDITGTSPEFRLQDSGANAALIAIRATNTANILDFSWGTGSLPASIRVGATEAIGITAGRNVTIAAPSSGVGLTVAGGGLAVTGGITGDLTGNASTATALQTARTINGVSFNGTANITVTASADTLTGSTLPALNGAALTALNASNLASGTVPDARFPATLPALNGSALTALNATQLTSGTVPTARITSVAASCTIDGVTVGFRSVPRSTTTTTAATSDVGKCIAASAGITIPNATFAAGDCLSIYNDSASSITITQGASLTLRLAGTTTTGNLTLQPRGMATVWFNTASEAIASGSGLSA